NFPNSSRPNIGHASLPVNPWTAKRSGRTRDFAAPGSVTAESKDRVSRLRRGFGAPGRSACHAVAWAKAGGQRSEVRAEVGGLLLDGYRGAVPSFAKATA